MREKTPPEPDYDDGLAALAERLSDFRDAGGDPTELAIAIDWLIRLFIARHEIEAHPHLHETEGPSRASVLDGLEQSRAFIEGTLDEGSSPKPRDLRVIGKKIDAAIKYIRTRSPEPTP